jgi:hypothetical protein
MLKIIFAILVITISGCQTTGDPTQGGLFGWSEEKAKLRQDELNQQLVKKQESLANERNKNITSLETKKKVSYDIKAREKTLKSLEADNSKIKKDIGLLMRKKHLKEADAKRLSIKLKENDYRRKISQTKPLDVRINEVNTQNSDLHDELQFLLKN